MNDYIYDDSSNIPALALVQQGSDPDTIATRWLLYVKADGLYLKSSIGTVIGPLTAPAIVGNDLDIEATGNADFNLSSNGQTVVSLNAYGSNNTLRGRRANGTKASPTVVVVNDILLRLAGIGYDGTQFPTGVAAALLDFLADGTWSASSRPSKITLATAPVGSTAAVVRVTIDNAGKMTVAGDFQQTGTKWAVRNATEITTPTVTGSRGGNAALASLLTQLAAQGIVIDGTTA